MAALSRTSQHELLCGTTMFHLPYRKRVDGGLRFTVAEVVSAHTAPPVRYSVFIVGPRGRAGHCFLLDGTCAATSVPD